ncbi:ammonia-forming cytochrome c nitrite reductase subunit c552 [Nannocystis bainbridge]|uniref:nitrite reductase (cytochrome; ammonia-forming) n=1 Tax=Nannocystis bainbridge TaxID=2995303 RepID=A0ABT5E5E1_9BACT|nr:ammonia-forming cytochrome c nitrite reductase subunit c552 [Nannocystis bainbridge]MDC0720930.1 ammonia-forming cytochrome c nitrite reductase subunit c552 [Nannocystis bainbridge]
MNAETNPEKPSAQRPRRRLLIALGIGALVAAVAAALAVALLIRVFEHKQEAKHPFFRVVELDESSTDPAVWAQNFPHHYDSYARTVDQVRTRHGGSEAVLRTPSDADPRSVVTQSKLAEDPRLVTLWRGYAFALDFREERGHAYMLDDQTFTGRHAVEQPGACLNCHASVVATYLELGGGDVRAGFDALNRMPYAQARERVSHPVACIDCHDPATMRLRITRPAFATGIAALKATQGVEDYDVHAQATRQEMRSYVCAQCHVEYYFAGPDKTLTYPWRQGARADEILAYYDEIGHKDWTHATTGAAALKAQHPEFEMWLQGTHARAGVACADCHMPYQRVGAAKVSSHHVRSPMLDINAACQTCHKATEEQLRERVETIQGRHLELRNLAMDAVVQLIEAIAAAQATPSPDEQRLAAAREYQRKAQFLLDFAEAENSTGFHAPQEAARVLAMAIDLARRGLVALWAPPD